MIKLIVDVLDDVLDEVEEVELEVAVSSSVALINPVPNAIVRFSPPASVTLPPVALPAAENKLLISQRSSHVADPSLGIPIKEHPEIPEVVEPNSVFV